MKLAGAATGKSRRSDTTLALGRHHYSNGDRRKETHKTYSTANSLPSSLSVTCVDEIPDPCFESFTAISALLAVTGLRNMMFDRLKAWG